jgi:hypothetical protein
MQLSDLLQAMARDGDGWTASVDESWLQGRSVFGGVQAALALRAMREHVVGALPLRTMQVTFVAPVPAGTIRLQSRLLRRGSSATQVEARIVAGDATLLLAVGVFGAARESVVVAPPPPGPPRGELELRMRTVPGYTPAFMHHFDACWRRGGLPSSGSPSREQQIELALHDRGPASEEHVIAFADFTPPIALSMLDRFAPASSMTWMLEMLVEDVSTFPLAGWRVDVHLDAGARGYTSQSLVLRAPDDTPVAIGTQNMVVFG